MEKITVKLVRGEKIVIPLTPDEATALALLTDEGTAWGTYSSQHSKELVRNTKSAVQKLNTAITAYHKGLKEEET